MLLKNIAILIWIIFIIGIAFYLLKKHEDKNN